MNMIVPSASAADMVRPSPLKQEEQGMLNGGGIPGWDSLKARLLPQAAPAQEITPEMRAAAKRDLQKTFGR